MNLQNLKGSVPLGSLLGIPIRLHLLFLVVLVVQCLGSIYYGPQAVLLWFVLMGPILLITVLLHELGHALGARMVGGDCEQILLWPLGGLAFIGHNAGPKADILVAAAGPLTHVPMVGFWVAMLAAATYAHTGTAGVSLVMPDPVTVGAFFQAMCVGALLMNISLFVFNLFVPAYPLDGGRILVGSLLACGVEQYLAAKITLGLAVPLAAGIMVFGILFFQMVTIMVSIFILFACWQLFDAVRKGQLEQHPLFSYESGTPGLGGGASQPEAANYYKFGQQGNV